MKKSLPLFAGTLLVMTTSLGAFGMSPAFADDHGDGGNGGAWNFSMQSNANMSSNNGSFTTSNSSIGSLPMLPSVASGEMHIPFGHDPGDHGKDQGHKDDHGKLGNKPEAEKTKTHNKVQGTGAFQLSGTTSSQSVTVHPSNSASLTQLHQELATFHQDIQKAKQAHQALIRSMKDFITAMQDAVAAGDLTAVQNGSAQAQTIISTLQQAVRAQEQADSESENSDAAAIHGNLAAALKAIQTAEAREVAKTAAMNAAASSLENLAKQIEAQVANYTASTNSNGSTANNTVSGSSNNTTVNGTSTGNGIVTINNNVQ